MSRPRCARRARAIAHTYSGAANQATEAWGCASVTSLTGMRRVRSVSDHGDQERSMLTTPTPRFGFRRRSRRLPTNVDPPETEFASRGSARSSSFDAKHASACCPWCCPNSLTFADLQRCSIPGAPHHLPSNRAKSVSRPTPGSSETPSSLRFAERCQSGHSDAKTTPERRLCPRRQLLSAIRPLRCNALVETGCCLFRPRPSSTVSALSRLCKPEVTGSIPVRSIAQPGV